MAFAAPSGAPGGAGPSSSQDISAAAQQRAAALAANPAAAGVFDPSLPHYEQELEINDFPQHARWKVHAAICDLPHVMLWISLHFLHCRSRSLPAPAPAS